jgi:hypothetical protein
LGTSGRHGRCGATRDRAQIARAFDAPLASAAGDGAPQRTRVLGNLLYTAPGEIRKRVLRRDAASSKYVEEK